MAGPFTHLPTVAREFTLFHSFILGVQLPSTSNPHWRTTFSFVFNFFFNLLHVPNNYYISPSCWIPNIFPVCCLYWSVALPPVDQRTLTNNMFILLKQRHPASNIHFLQATLQFRFYSFAIRVGVLTHSGSSYFGYSDYRTGRFNFTGFLQSPAFAVSPVLLPAPRSHLWSLVIII